MIFKTMEQEKEIEPIEKVKCLSCLRDSGEERIIGTRVVILTNAYLMNNGGPS